MGALVGSCQILWTAQGSLQQRLQPEQAALTGKEIHQLSKLEQGSHWSLCWSKGSRAVPWQLSHVSQGRSQARAGVWLGHTTYLCWGQQMELKCSSKVKQGSLKGASHSSFSPTSLSQPYDPSLYSYITSVLPSSTGSQASAGGMHSRVLILWI